MSGRGRIAGLLALVVGIGGSHFSVSSDLVVAGTLKRSPSSGNLPNVGGCCFDQIATRLSTMSFKSKADIMRFLQGHCALIVSIVTEGDDATHCEKSLGYSLPAKVNMLTKIVGKQAGICVFMGSYDGATDINLLLDLGTMDNWHENVPAKLMDELVACSQREYMVFLKDFKAANYRITSGKNHLYRWRKTKDLVLGCCVGTEPSGDWSRMLTAKGPLYLVYEEDKRNVYNVNYLLGVKPVDDDSDSSSSSNAEDLGLNNGRKQRYRVKKVTRIVTTEEFVEEVLTQSFDQPNASTQSFLLNRLTQNALY